METNPPKEKMQGFIDFKLFEKREYFAWLRFVLFSRIIYIDNLNKINPSERAKIGGGLLQFRCCIITSKIPCEVSFVGHATALVHIMYSTGQFFCIDSVINSLLQIFFGEGYYEG